MVGERAGGAIRTSDAGIAAIVATAAVGSIAIAVVLQRLAPAALLPFTFALAAGAAGTGFALLRSRRRMQAETDLLETVARSARDIIWTLDVDQGRLTYVSPAAETVLGVAPKELLARASFSSLFSPATEERMGRELARAVGEGREEVLFEAEHIRPDGGSVWLEVRLSFVRDATGRLRRVVGLSRDISERKRLEGSLARSAETLERAQRMEALGQLTGGVAHDFNNLLTVVVGSLDLARDGVPEGSDASEHLAEAQAAAERGALLTQRLLAFARRQPLRPAAIDLRALVASMSQMLSRTLGEQISLVVVHGAGLWHCEADASQVEQAILNLALNARDAMPRGGTLTIETANVEIGDAYGAGDPELRPGSYVMLAVSDEGEGMAPEVAERAFEPFFTTKAASHGSGLGLSMVYGFAKQSGGHAKIASEPGRGTTVTVYLPRASRVGIAADEPRDMAIDEWRARGETVIAVDDDAAVRNLTLVMLHSLGFRSIPAADASEALRLLEEHDEARLLVTDVVLPGGMDGFELAKRARALRADLGVLFTSGYTGDTKIGQRLAAGEPFLPKPFRRIELARHLRTLVEAGERRR